ncbi:MAG: dihydrofolate reductase [bacterium]
MKISCAAALDHNRLIGSEGEIPWHLPADLKHFRQLTLGHPIIMGRKTHESIGVPLDQRLNIILTNDDNYETFDDCKIVHSKAEALRTAKGTESDEATVIGGESIYEMFLPETDVLHLTVVHDTFEGSVYFPDFSVSEWTITGIEDHRADQENPHDYSFYTLKRDPNSTDTPPESQFDIPGFLADQS